MFVTIPTTGAASPHFLWSDPRQLSSPHAHADAECHTFAVNLASTTSEDVLRGSWSSFDAVVSNLGTVHRVCFGFSSEKDMARFMRDVVDRAMPHISTRLEIRSGIQYDIVWEHDRYQDRFVAPDSKYTEGTPIEPFMLPDLIFW